MAQLCRIRLEEENKRKKEKIDPSREAIADRMEWAGSVKGEFWGPQD